MTSTAAKTIVLITGANSGLGLALAAELMKRGSYHVLFGSRSVTKGEAALKELQSHNLPGSAELLEMDVTNDDIIDRAAASVKSKHGKVDVIINNAAISGSSAPGSVLSTTLAAPSKQIREGMQSAFDTNATGPAVVTEAFGPLLRQSKAISPPPRIINVSSGAGSINRRLDASSPSYKVQTLQYRASKSALNMVTACQFVEYGPVGIKVFAYNPGFVVSNLGPHNNVENGAKPAAEAVLPLMDVIEGKRDDEAGSFLNFTGQYAW